MKTRKHTWKYVAFFDFSEVKRYLEKKAREGWVLEHVLGIWWTFRRAEPRPAQVWVSYLQQDVYDPQPSQQLENLADLGEHTGWKLTVDTPTMQVFYNWETDPLPMETDPVAHVEGMHRALKRSVLGVYRGVFGLALAALLVQLWYWWEAPLQFLSREVNYFLVDVLFVVALGTELGAYRLWRNRARKRAAQGEWLDTRPWGWASRLVLWGYLVLWVIAMALPLMGNQWVRRANLFFLVSGLAFVAGMWLVVLLRDLLRRRKVRRGLNEVVTAAVSFFLVMAFISVLAAVCTRWNGFSPTASDSWWKQYPDGLPLTVERLRGDVGDQEFWVHRDGEESLVLGQYQGWQITEEETGPEEDMDTVMYTVTLVKVPLFYDLCRDEILWADHKQVDPSPWLAREVYRETDHGRLRTYLLCYDTCLVQISFGWEPTQEQMQLVGETFGGLQ